MSAGLRRALWTAGEPAHARRLKFGFAAPTPDPTVCDYFSTHNSGFFSNASTALDDVLALARAGIRTQRIDYSRGMGLYKTWRGRDVYDRFFRFDGTFEPSVAFDSEDVHRPFQDLDLAKLRKAALRYFTPSREALRLAEEFANEIGFAPAETIAVYYRGTDKSKEIGLAPIEDYLAAVRILDNASHQRRPILIQTDQAQARDKFVEAFGQRAKYFSRMAVTRRKKGLHKQWLHRALAGGGETSGLQMLAAVWLLSQCADLVLCSGNVGAWIAFYRGHSQGLSQFDSTGRLRTPA